MKQTLVGAVSLVVLLGCAGSPAPGADSPAAPKTPEAPARVVSTLQPTAGHTVAGEVALEPVGDNAVMVAVSIEGATPGLHGVHIHQFDDCSAADASSAGGHLNPQGYDHALPPQDARHLGDLGNVEIESDGTGYLEIVIEDASLTPDEPFSFLGRALIVHADEDTGEGEAGDAGERVACAELNV